MSIADKLLTIANNTPAVIEAVNASKATTTCRADNVLATEHPLQIQTTAGAEVNVYGKNLISDAVKDWSNYDSNALYHLSLPPGTYTVWGSFNNADSAAYVYFEKSTDGGATWETKNIGVSALLSDGSISTAGYIVIGTEATRYVTFTVTDDANEKWAIWTREKDIAKINYLQLEAGTVATEYEPYKAPQTATADENGKVTGLVPVSPTMTIAATAAVECTYFPESAADTYGKYQQLRQKQIALKNYINE